jgi:outer membrane protein OmpA-like peptidoglycan-associated protein
LNEEYNLVVDNKRIKERTIASGQIKTISNPSYGVSFGLETLLRAGKTTFLTQKAVIDWNLNNIASDVTWKALSLRIELGIRFGFNGREGAITDPPPAPIPNKPSVATETADIRPVDKELKLKCRIDSIEGVINTGEEFLASLPLVNCVFFDRNSAEIGDYYAKEADERLLFFTGNAVEMHKYILVQISNIIKNNPEARIILKGATSGKENEDGGRLLAKSRAESVRDALAELGVNTGMIEINYDEMPETPSNQDYKEGLAENQRVDIIVKNAALQEYVSIQKYAEFEGRVSAYVDFENTDSIVVLKNGTSSQNQICKSSGIYFVPVRKRISRPGEDVAISLTLVSGKYETIDEKRFPTPALKKIPLELNLRAFDAVIRFDYNSSKLSEENKRLLKQMSDFLPGGSEILIYGSSDALGTEKRNVQLSGERAKMAEEYIRSVSGRKFIIRTEINTDKFPEDTPQGRFLNRSIRIRVGIKN